jgi:hypothetical protein
VRALSLVLLAACAAPPGGGGPAETDVDAEGGDSDPAGSDQGGTGDSGDDTDVVDTDASDTDPDDTDTGPPDTDADPDVVDTDTDVADTDVADTGVDTDGPAPRDTDTADTAADTDPPPDADHDGSPADLDCDDADPTAYPGAPERCDGRRQDCDRAWPGAEDGTASFVAGDGTWADVTPAFPAAGPAAAWSPPTDGTLWLCAGEHHARIELAAGTLAVRGRGGADAVVLDADASGSVAFAALGTTLVVDGLTLTDGLAPYGGGLRAVEARVTVTDAVIRGNVSSYSGGGVSVSTFAAGTLDLVRTRVEDNVTGGDGGGAYVGLAGTSRARLEDVEVRRNRAYGYTGGGACLVPGDDATLAVDGAVFEENAVGWPGGALAAGGGLWVDAATRSAITVLDATFRRNDAGGDATRPARLGWGGGLGIRQVGTGAVVVTDVTAEHGTVAVDTAGTAVGLGGGVYVAALSAPVALTRLVLVDNVAGGATTSAGGGLWVGSASPGTVTGVDWQLVEGRTDGNTTSGSGGGVAVARGPLVLRGGVVAGDTAASGGGVAVLDGSVALVDGTVIRGGHASYGGALSIAGVASCTGDDAVRPGLRGNVASVAGGAAWLVGPSTLTATRCDLGATGAPDDNLAAGAPSDVAWPGSTEVPYDDDATFTCDSTGCL